MVRKNNSRAFSLIETLFATFLVAICASIIAATVPLANSNRARADMLNQATNIAQKELEAIRQEGYPNISASKLVSAGLLDSAIANGSGEYPFTNCDSSSYGSPKQVLPNGQGWLKITQISNDLRQLTVRVQWTDRGKTKSVILISLVGNL